MIIPKNAAIPCQRSDQFYLDHEDQTEARVEILQGEPDVERDKCLLIGELLLKNLSKEAKRSAHISALCCIVTILVNRQTRCWGARRLRRTSRSGPYCEGPAQSVRLRCRR